MMAQCPKCFASITDDFGLTECASCSAQLLVHIDGTVEFSGAGSDEVTDPDAPSIPESPVEEPAYEEPAFEDPPFEESRYDEAAAEPAVELIDDEPLPVEPTPEEPIFDEPAADGPPPEYDFDEPEAAPPAAPSAPSGNGSPDLSDIAQFGNSGASGGRDGALRYNVRVRGIDTVDVRDAFREALTDRKFVWDTDEIIRSIRDGECEIADVSSVKAHILVSRLRELPVEVEWEQYAIHQT